MPLEKRNYVLPIYDRYGKVLNWNHKKRLPTAPHLLAADGKTKIPPTHQLILNHEGDWVVHEIQLAGMHEAVEQIASLMQIGLHHLPVTYEERAILNALKTEKENDHNVLIGIISRIKQTSVFRHTEQTGKQPRLPLNSGKLYQIFQDMIISHREQNSKDWMNAFNELKEKMSKRGTIIVLPPELEKEGKKK